MTILVGSARNDENGKYIGGAAGDNLQNGTDDTAGEVSMQTMYTHPKGWLILRPSRADHANAIAERMKAACNNKNIGYDQYGRLGIIKYGIDTRTPTECDCSSLVRECVREATGKDPGNFITSNEATMLEATGLFNDRIAYVNQSQTPVYDGDVLVTKTKGHTVIVVSGNPRTGVLKAVAATDAAQGFNKELAGTYVVTASMLNVRNGAGTFKKKLVEIPKGSKVKCYGYYTGVLGRKWLYVQFTYEGVTYTGFCSSKYLAKA